MGSAWTNFCGNWICSEWSEGAPPVRLERRAAYHDVVPAILSVRLGDERVGSERGGGQLRVGG